MTSGAIAAIDLLLAAGFGWILMAVGVRDCEIDDVSCCAAVARPGEGNPLLWG
jgi:hypothetical protein